MALWAFFPARYHDGQGLSGIQISNTSKVFFFVKRQVIPYEIPRDLVYPHFENRQENIEFQQKYKEGFLLFWLRVDYSVGGPALTRFLEMRPLAVL